MGYDLTSVNGDVAVGRNAEIGGNADIKGGLNVRKNMKVEGFLDAPNIKGVIKGLFASEDDLKKEFPNPRPGWAAVVLDSGSTNGFLYLAARQGWKKTGEESEPLSFIVDSINTYATKEELNAEVQRAIVQENQINSAVEGLADITVNTAKDIFNETQRAKEAEQELGEAIGDVHNELAENDEAIKKDAMNYRTLSASHYADKVVISGDSLKGEKRTADISAATPETAGVMSAEDKVNLANSTVIKVTWDSSSDMNNYTTAGVYHIKGERLNIDDNLPIANSNPGHTIDARLTVLDSSIAGTNDLQDKCITQVLSFSNRLGQGEVYIRTGKGSSLDNLTWEKWSTLQRNVNVGSLNSKVDLKKYIDNGIYSGVFRYGSSRNEMRTFVMVVINDYAIGLSPRRVSQFLYSIDKATGKVSYETQTCEGETWNGWQILNKGEIDSMISVAVDNAIKGIIANAPEAFDTLKEIADWIANDETGAVALANAISTNTAAITAERTRAIGQEGLLNNAIAAEVTRAKAAEKSNADAINAEVTRAKAAEQANATAINAEATRAKAAEKSNADAITAEVTRAKAAEQANATAINAEATRAKAAEKELGEAIGYAHNELAEEKKRLVNGDTVVGLTREVYSRQGKVDAATFLKRTTAGGTSISDGVASIRQIGGNIVKNLLGQINSIAVNVKYDISLANANVAITAKDNYIGDSASSTYIGIKTGKYFSGHKYYIAANCYSDVERKVSVSLGCNGYGVSGSMFYFPITGAGEWTYVSKLVELNIENPVPYFSIFPFGHVDEYIQAGVLVFAGGINIIDLTEMFGAGKEPTKEDCDKMFATMGTMSQGLTVAQPLGLKSTGFNQWNPVNLFTGKTVADNTIVDGDKSIAFFECLPCRVGAGENNGYVIGYGEGDDWSDAGIEVYLTPIYPMTGDGLLYAHKLEKDATTGTYVPKIKGYLLVVTPVTDKLCAHFLWSGDRAMTDYEEYIESSVSLPAIPQMGEWGLAGIAASGVLDTIDLENNKFTKRVGCVDLGTLQWLDMSLNGTRFRTTGLDMKRVSNKIQLVCDKYTVLPTVYGKETYTNNTALKDVIFPVSFDNDINIMTSVEYASVADFKAAVSGVKLYYELPAYEEYPITAKAAPNYVGSDYGVEQFEGSKIPLAANILFYMRSLVSETRNFLDRMYANTSTTDANEVADYITEAISTINAVFDITDAVKEKGLPGLVLAGELKDGVYSCLLEKNDFNNNANILDNSGKISQFLSESDLLRGEFRIKKLGIFSYPVLYIDAYTYTQHYKFLVRGSLLDSVKISAELTDL